MGNVLFFGAAIGAGQHNLRQLDGRLAIIDGILDRIPGFVWNRVDGT